MAHSWSKVLSEWWLDSLFWIAAFKLRIHIQNDAFVCDRVNSNAPFTRGIGVNTSRLLWMEWRQALPNWIVGPSHRFTDVARGRSWKLFLTFQAPTQVSANQIALCKYPSVDTSQSRSCNTRKVCDWLLSLWRSRQHQASDTPSVKRWRPVWMGRNGTCSGSSNSLPRVLTPVW